MISDAYQASFSGIRTVGRYGQAQNAVISNNRAEARTSIWGLLRNYRASLDGDSWRYTIDLWDNDAQTVESGQESKFKA